MKKQVLAYLHTHFDREWYRTKEEFNLRLLEIFDEIISELLKGRAPCFYFDGQTDAVKNYLKFRPQMFDVIKKLVKEKKLYFGPFSTLADSFLINPKLLEKNLEMGIKYAKTFGMTDFIGYLADTFGHGKNIFEIFKKFNIKNVIMWRGVPNIDTDFKANGLNCVRLVKGYAVDLFHNGATPSQIEAFIDEIAKYSKDKILLPIGSDHLKILSNSSEKIAQINKGLKKYEIKLTSPFEYFENFKPEKNIEGEFLYNDNSFILQGVYASRIYQKAKNAILTHEILQIEKFDKMQGSKYAPSIDFAYDLLIKNHAHDSIYGCSTDEVHKMVDMRYDKAEQVLNGVKARFLRDLKRNIKKEGILAVNLSENDFSGVIEVQSAKKIQNAQMIGKFKGFEFDKLYDTDKIPITEDYKTIYRYLVKTPKLKPSEIKCFEPVSVGDVINITDNKIENENISLSILRGKININDKKSGRILKDCLKITDTDDLGDSYNFAPKQVSCILPILKTRVVECGRLRSILRIFYKNLTLDVILKSGASRLEFEAKINNKKKNHKLQAQFMLEKPISQTVSDGAIRVHNPSICLLDNMPAKYPNEAKTNCFPLLRNVFAQNVAIITLGLQEYEIYKNTLSIPLLRAFGVISNKNNPARSIPAGPPIETPQAQCLGDNNAKFALCFEKYLKNIERQSDEFYGATAHMCL